MATVRKVVLVNIDEDLVPKETGVVRNLELGDLALEVLEGWTVISHTITQQLSGVLLLSIFCEQAAPGD